MGEELRNTEWILANVSLWLLPLLSFSIFILFFSSYIAIYILNVVDGLRNLFLLSYRFRGPRFDHRSSIGATIPSRLKLFAIVCRLRWLESSNRDYFPRIFRYFSNFFFLFLFFDKFEGAKEPFYREEIAATLIDIDIRNKFIFGTIW